MIMRIWHGWTAPEKADLYEALLREEIFIEISNRNIKGYRGIKLLRRTLPVETEFITLMTFDDLDAVKEFAGADYEQCVVPARARAILTHFDAHSQHYELRVDVPETFKA
jgi:hypothetical protein